MTQNLVSLVWQGKASALPPSLAWDGLGVCVHTLRMGARGALFLKAPGMGLCLSMLSLPDAHVLGGESIKCKPGTSGACGEPHICTERPAVRGLVICSGMWK